MKGFDIQTRCHTIATRVVKMIAFLPNNCQSYAISHQIIRSASSVGANYRAACRSKSRRDFINKLKIVEEEADETLFWLELIEESGFFSKGKLDSLKLETDELISMIVASLKTLKSQNLKS